MRVKALGNINSGQYVAGDVFELSDSEADELIEAGVVIEATDDDDKVKVDEVPPTEAPATENPLAEQPVASDSQEEAKPVETPKTKQPTAEQIDQDLANEAGSPNSQNEPIS